MEAMAPLGEQEMYRMMSLNGMGILPMNGALPPSLSLKQPPPPAPELAKLIPNDPRTVIRPPVPNPANGVLSATQTINGTANLQPPPHQPQANSDESPGNDQPTTNGNNQNVGGGGSTGSGRSTPTGPETPNSAKLFVGGLSWQTSVEKLRQYFGVFGPVADVLIMKDPMTQRSRGFGFITFADQESVEKVLKVPIHTLDGKKIDPKHATPKNKPKMTNKTKKIFVGGVSQETTAEEVRSYFGQFGKVEECVMLMDQQTKRHRGFGFVTFENEDVVDRICEIHFHTIKSKKVECKKAQPKEAVASANLLLGKRVMVGPLGMRMAAPSQAAVAAAAASPLVAVQHAAAAAVAAQNAVAASTAGKFLSGYPGLASYRYAPYPTMAAAPTAAPPTQAAPQLTPGAGVAPYQGYSLANVDMSSFQGVDWGAMYGMGMYV